MTVQQLLAGGWRGFRKLSSVVGLEAGRNGGRGKLDRGKVDAVLSRLKETAA